MVQCGLSAALAMLANRSSASIEVRPIKSDHGNRTGVSDLSNTAYRFVPILLSKGAP